MSMKTEVPYDSNLNDNLIFIKAGILYVRKGYKMVIRLIIYLTYFYLGLSF